MSVYLQHFHSALFQLELLRGDCCWELAHSGLYARNSSSGASCTLFTSQIGFVTLPAVLMRGVRVEGMFTCAACKTKILRWNSKVLVGRRGRAGARSDHCQGVHNLYTFKEYVFVNVCIQNNTECAQQWRVPCLTPWLLCAFGFKRKNGANKTPL